jgi:predicted nucleic acid-binding protein
MQIAEKYVCDADCLINLHRHFGRASLKALRSLGRRGALKLPEGVIREIKRGTDKLAQFMEKEEQVLEVTISNDPNLCYEIARLEKSYGEKIIYGQQEYSGFWKSRAGRKAADAQVVAVAKLLNSIVISNDRAVQLACSLEGVSCINWAEFARRIGLVKPKQLKLNLGL